jgi:hypothetical protein
MDIPLIGNLSSLTDQVGASLLATPLAEGEVHLNIGLRAANRLIDGQPGSDGDDEVTIAHESGLAESETIRGCELEPHQ